MKRSFVAIVAACVLLTGTSVLAASPSLVGKKVAKEVVIEKNGVKSAKKAVVIDGFTYAPVRDIAESAGYSVTFKGDVVILQDVQKILEEPQTSGGDAEKSEIIRLQNSIKSYGFNIDNRTTYELNPDKANLAAHLAKGGTDERDKAVTEGLQKKIKDSEEYIAGQQALIDAAQARIKELQTQINE